MDAERALPRSGGEARKAATAFAQPIKGQGAFQLLTSFGPFIAACAAMYLVFPISYFLTLALAVPAGALLVRIFIVQHDCGHGSFFASASANAMVGRACSLFTMTPFANWARQHSLHHASWSNLDRRQGGDLYSVCLTVREYLALSRWRRLLHRVPRHPLVANVLLPPLVFLVLYRVPFDTPRGWVRERRSVYLTNAALVALFATLALLLGWREVLMVHLPLMFVASILGVWLFSLQHRFEGAHWARKAEWSPGDASLHGSSWFALPRPLHWLTGNIGFHHIHHLSSRIPNYALQKCMEENPEFQNVTTITLWSSIKSLGLNLWDEEGRRLVSFRQLKRLQRQQQLS